MNSMSKHHSDDCDSCQKEKKQCPTIIKCSCPSSTVIPTLTKSGTTFTVASLTLNTSELCNPCVKLEFASNIVIPAGSTGGSISLQVFKSCDNQFNPIPIGSVLNFTPPVPAPVAGPPPVPAPATSSTFSFFICDCDSCFNGCCTYTVVATVTTPIDGVAFNINNAVLGAVLTCGSTRCC